MKRYRVFPLVLCILASYIPALSGYEATGYLTYTTSDSVARPAARSSTLFQVRIEGAQWRIRTEPAIERQGGIAYHEAWNDTNGVITAVTALSKGINALDSPFTSLRAHLASAGGLKSSSHLQPSDEDNPLGAPGFLKSGTNNIGNAAVAVARKSTFPPIDSSYIGFVWYVFTAPTVETAGGQGMLMQVWDDGNPTRTRFRRASWAQFPQEPFLLSSASYTWAGIEIGADGARRTLNLPGGVPPARPAARYEVTSATNVQGLTLPLRFKLERFQSQSAEGSVNTLLTTINGVTVTACAGMNNAVAAVPVLPTRTYVSDYRMAADGLKDRSLHYMVESNGLPSMTAVKKSAIFRRALAAINDSGRRSVRGRCIAVFVLLVAPIVVFAVYRRFHWRGREPKKLL